MAYATPDELRRQIEIPLAEGDQDVLEDLLTAATEAINNYCNRAEGFGAADTATPRFYAGTGRSYLAIDDCIAVTEVATKTHPTDTAYVALDSDAWMPFSGDSRRPNFNAVPYTKIMLYGTGYVGFPRHPDDDPLTFGPTVRVTARWGTGAAVPAVVKQATITQASRWYKRAQGAWGDAIGSPEMGQTFYRKVIDPDIQFMLQRGRLIAPSIG